MLTSRSAWSACVEPDFKFENRGKITKWSLHDVGENNRFWSFLQFRRAKRLRCLIIQLANESRSSLPHKHPQKRPETMVYWGVYMYLGPFEVVVIFDGNPNKVDDVLLLISLKPYFDACEIPIFFCFNCHFSTRTRSVTSRSCVSWLL